MAYQTGSYASRDQLIGSIKYFAESNGWTTDHFGDFRGGKQLSIHNSDGIYCHWYSANNVPVNAYYRDMNGVYGGYSARTIVLHVGEGGYDSAKHPAWQPGVAGGNSYANTGSARAILCGGDNFGDAGIYHFIAAPGLLAVFINTLSDAFMRYFAVGRVSQLAGGDLSHFASASLGPFSVNIRYAGDFMLFGEPNPGEFFYVKNLLRAGGQWGANFYDADGKYVAFGMTTPGVARNSFDSMLMYSQPSGASGIAPLYPGLLVKRVSGVLRPAGVLDHIAHLNAASYNNGDLIQTTSGAWRVFRVDTSGKGVAVRVDA